MEHWFIIEEEKGGHMLHKYKYSRLWAGITAMAAAGSAMANNYIPATDGAIADPAQGWDDLWAVVLEDITILGGAFRDSMCLADPEISSSPRGRGRWVRTATRCRSGLVSYSNVPLHGG